MKISIPSSITVINNGTFRNCSSITSVSIPNLVIKICKNAFDSCCSLSNIVLPSSLIEIEANAFSNCHALQSIAIPKSVKKIEFNICANCANMTSFVVNSKNTVYSSIDGVLFSKNKTILYVYPNGKRGNYTIPSTTTELDYGAFDNANNLNAITINNKIHDFKNTPFYGCSNLTDIIVDKGNPSFSSHNGVLYDKKKDVLLEYPLKKIGSYTISDSCKRIDNNAFNDCMGLTEILMPNSLFAIGNYAFNNCTNLISLSLPKSIIEIGEGAFENCNSLKSITINNPIPVVFNEYNTPFTGIDKTIPLYVPKNTKNAYASANAWKEFTNIVEHN